MTSEIAPLRLEVLRGAGLAGTYKLPELEGMVPLICDVRYRESKDYERGAVSLMVRVWLGAMACSL